MYAVLALYLIVCSVILSIEAFKGALAVDGSIGAKIANLFTETKGVLIAAVLSTVGTSTHRVLYGRADQDRNLPSCITALCKLSVAITEPS